MNKFFVVLLSIFFATTALSAQQILIESSTLESGFSHGDVRLLMDENAVKTNENVEELYNWGSSTGLEAINEGNGLGLTRINRDPNLFGNLGQNAFDISYSDAPNSTRGATALNSYAEGKNTTAAGENSHVEGFGNQALGNNSHAEGEGTIALNNTSHAAGKYNIGTSTDTIFEVGIGTNVGDKKNAIEIYNNGRIRVPELSLVLHDDVKSLTTKEYVDGRSVSNSFVDSDLTGDILTITHNLNERALHVTVENDTGQVVLPTVQYVNIFSLTLDFSGMTVSNTWYYRISK